MKIALLDSWPNLTESAELEFIKRFTIAASNLPGIQAHRVVTSDDIYDLQPDAVLCSHEYSRKLTEFPTIGLLWSPLSFFVDDEYRRASVLSYDGYVVGNETLRNYVSDITFGRPIGKPTGPGLFLPTTYRTGYNSLRQVTRPSLCYLGVHWDGSRHGRVFEELVKRDIIRVYGPGSSWSAYPNNYGGMIPFDGKSVQETIARHGVALCLHKKEHRQQNTPSMRIFEALSVGALPICDQIEFARTELGDIALFVDTTKSPRAIVDQIQEHLNWILNNPQEARERADRGKAWFDKNWCLEEKILSTIIPTIEEVRSQGRFNYRAVEKIKPPSCEVIIRTGGRDILFLERAVASLVAANSDEFPLGVIVVDYKGRDDIRAFVQNISKKNIRAKYVKSPDNGYRSTALWNGLRAATAQYVAHLDDDDSVHPNHYRQLHQALLNFPNAPLAYSGVIKKEDDEGKYFQAINFQGPAEEVIRETRELFFLDDYDITRLAQFDNYIQSNTWMARTHVVKEIIGEDPRLEVIEDVYLYLLLAQRGAFAFTAGATAFWHWRSLHADNSMTSVSLAKWMRDGQRVARRLENLKYHYSPDLGSLKVLKPERSSSIELGEHFNIESDLEPLGHDSLVEGGSALSDRVAFKGFHPAEASGVWSRELNSQFVFRLDEDVQVDGALVVVEFIASDNGDPDRRLFFSLNGGAAVSVTAVGWEPARVQLPLSPKSGASCTISIDLSSLYVPDAGSSDTRKLGVHIKSLSLVRVDEPSQTIALNVVDMKGSGALPPSTPQIIVEPTSSSELPVLAADRSRELLSPVLSFFHSGAYTHVGISESQSENGVTICKLQTYLGNRSIQFDILNLPLGEEIDKKFVEMDGGPVFRIYFNADEADIRRRVKALPQRLVRLLRDITYLGDDDYMVAAPRESVGAVAEILRAIQHDLRGVSEILS